MKKIFFLALSIVFTINFSFSQNKTEIIKETLKKYPDSKYLITNSIQEYTFLYSTKTQKVTADLYQKEMIMALKDDNYFPKYIMYDSRSSVEKLYLYPEKGRPRLNNNYKSGKLLSNDIFFDDNYVCQFSLNISSPGEIYGYSYIKSFNDVKYLTRAFFHSHFPQEDISIKFSIPDWLKIELVEINFKDYDIKKDEHYDIKTKSNIITYTMHNTAPIIGGFYSINPLKQMPHIVILSKEYTIKGKTTTLFKETADLYKWYRHLLDGMDNKPEKFKDFVDQLLKDNTTDDEKIKTIFYWVQDHIRYIAYEDGIMGFKPANAYEVFDKKYGDCKGMANITCEMLKAAGFDARLTWIGTRALPYDYDLASLAVDNHMITTLMYKDSMYFLDATETGVAFKDYAFRIQGQDVMIENGKDFIISKVPEFNIEHNQEQSVLNLNLKDNKLIGNGYYKYTGEKRINMYRNIKTVSKANLEKSVGKYIGNYNKNNDITNVVISDYLNRDLPIEFNFDITISNTITEVENEKYINIETDFDFSKLKIKEERNLNIDFRKKELIDKTINLKIDSEYKVDYLPESILIDNDEFSFDIKYSFNEKTNTINYTKRIIIKTGIISNSNFEAWNKTIKKLNTLYKDQIILIKN